MPSQPLESDYLVLSVSLVPRSETVQKYLDHLRTFPEGSAIRLEMEAQFLRLTSEYVKGLADRVRASGELTLYDIR